MQVRCSRTWWALIAQRAGGIDELPRGRLVPAAVQSVRVTGVAVIVWGDNDLRRRAAQLGALRPLLARLQCVLVSLEASGLGAECAQHCAVRSATACPTRGARPRTGRRGSHRGCVCGW